MADEVDMADVALATYEELMDLERDFEDTETEIRKYPCCPEIIIRVLHGLSP